MDRYKTTFETWNKVAPVYQDKFMNLDLYDDTYDVFCGLINKRDPKIFEIGCGPGNITKYLVSKRPDLNITAIDVAPNMIKLAKQNIPTADFKVMDCRQMDKITGKFDGIMCGFCIPYLSKEDCSKLFKDSFKLLETGGYLYFSAIRGNYAKSGFETGSTGDKAYVYYYEEDDLQKELLSNRFEIVRLFKKYFPKVDGTIQEHLVFIAQKK